MQGQPPGGYPSQPGTFVSSVAPVVVSVVAFESLNVHNFRNKAGWSRKTAVRNASWNDAAARHAAAR